MSSGPASTRRGYGDFIGSKWPRLFFGAVLVQAIICIAFEAYVFGRFQESLRPDLPTNLNANVQQTLSSQLKSIPTFLTLIIFGFIYELLLAWDALRFKNTIQVIGLTVANIAFLIYTSLQIDQIRTSISCLKSFSLKDNVFTGNASSCTTAGSTVDPNALNGDDTDQNVWTAIQPFLIVIPIICALGTVLMGYFSWQLYQVFSWDILKQIGADYRMKKRFLHYQIYIALLKFDFFFFLGFTVQFLVIVNGKTGLEFGLTTAAIPITILILIAAAFFTQHENRPGMLCVITIYFGGLAYFFFKLVRIYQPYYEQNYEAVRKSLTAFAVMTILLIILTITNAFVCMNNFNHGLKAHLVKSRNNDPEKEYPNSFQMQDQKGQLPSRMTID